jgi:tetratricopeptide (TPR) repeat protein
MPLLKRRHYHSEKKRYFIFCYIMLLFLCIGCAGSYRDKTGARIYPGGEVELKGYTQLLEKDPKNSIALYLRGCSYYNIRNFDAAIADFDKVLEINKRHVSSTAPTKSTSSSTDSPSPEASREFLKMQQISQAANLGVGSRTGFAGTVGRLGPLWALGSGPTEQPKVITKEEKIGRKLFEDALKLRVTASKSRAESFENAGQIPEARSVFTEYITFYNNLSPDQQQRDFVSEMYRLSMGKLDTLPGKK